MATTDDPTTSEMIDEQGSSDFYTKEEMIANHIKMQEGLNEIRRFMYQDPNLPDADWPEMEFEASVDAIDFHLRALLLGAGHLYSDEEKSLMRQARTIMKEVTWKESDQD